LQYQDWFTEWMDYPLTDAEEQTVITYARGCQDNCVTFFHTGTRSPNRITN
jgi:hypothetical protein